MPTTPRQSESRSSGLGCQPGPFGSFGRFRCCILDANYAHLSVPAQTVAVEGKADDAQRHKAGCFPSTLFGAHRFPTTLVPNVLGSDSINSGTIGILVSAIWSRISQLIASNKGQREERHEVEEEDAHLVEDDSRKIDRVKLLSRHAESSGRESDRANREEARTGWTKLPAIHN